MYNYSTRMSSLEREIREIEENQRIEKKYKRLRDMDQFYEQEKIFFASIQAIDTFDSNTKRKILAESMKFDVVLADMVEKSDIYDDVSYCVKILQVTDKFLKASALLKSAESTSTNAEVMVQRRAVLNMEKEKFIKCIDRVIQHLSPDCVDKITGATMAFVGGIIACITFGWVTSVAEAGRHLFNSNRVQVMNTFKQTILESQDEKLQHTIRNK